jgi:hypothetical protein
MSRILFFLICMAALSRVSAQDVNNTITIPVVVHVLYNNASQNISDAQVLSQLIVLNRDFRGANPDLVNVPSYFAGRTADCGIEFQLARVDPDGKPTSGIIRKQTGIQMFGLDDRIKSSKEGGDAAWDRNRYLNIWVGNLAGGIAGYTSAMNGPAEKDGVVIHYTNFGTTGSVSAPYNLGRTATHEIGHWLNLVHIWGDEYCGDDHVDDTPRQRSSNKGCPTGVKISCGTDGYGDMYMNFMDLTGDACMNMFTKGQRARMRALFEKGGLRHALLSSGALNVKGHSELPAPSPVAPAALPVSTVRRISVFPNPASQEIAVRMEGASSAATSKYVIYNYAGQPMLSGVLNAQGDPVNISSLAAGIYLLKEVNTGSMVKFVKK